MTLINSAPNEKFIMSMVKDSILNEEVRRKEHGLIVTPS